MNATMIPMVKVGDSGDAVRVLQRLLVFQSISVPRLMLTVDGVFGRDTYNAVLTFQKQRGLTQDGIVGQMTWQELSALPGDM